MRYGYTWLPVGLAALSLISAPGVMADETGVKVSGGGESPAQRVEYVKQAVGSLNAQLANILHVFGLSPAAVKEVIVLPGSAQRNATGISSNDQHSEFILTLSSSELDQDQLSIDTVLCHEFAHVFYRRNVYDNVRDDTENDIVPNTGALWYAMVQESKETNSTIAPYKYFEEGRFVGQQWSYGNAVFASDLFANAYCLASLQSSGRLIDAEIDPPTPASKKFWQLIRWLPKFRIGRLAEVTWDNVAANADRTPQRP